MRRDTIGRLCHARVAVARGVEWSTATGDPFEAIAEKDAASRAHALILALTWPRPILRTAAVAQIGLRAWARERLNRRAPRSAWAAMNLSLQASRTVVATSP